MKHYATSLKTAGAGKSRLPLYLMVLSILIVTICAGCIGGQQTHVIPGDVPGTGGLQGSPAGTAASTYQGVPAGDTGSARPSGYPAINTTMNITIPVTRIVVANSNAAEVLIAIGAKDRIVGVSDTVKSHPILGPQFESTESIGNWQTPNVERILALRPDVVISYASSVPKNVDQFTAARIPILFLDCYRLDTLPADVRVLGNLTGNEAESERYVDFMEEHVETVRSRLGNLSPASPLPSVYFEGYSEYVAQPGSSGSGLLVRLAGGKNIGENLPGSAPKVNAEWLVTEDPEVIVKVVSLSKDGTNMTDVRSRILNRTGLGNVTAIRSGRTYCISGDIAYGPRSLVGLLYFARILHPAEFPDIRPQGVLDEYAGSFVPGTNLTRFFYPEPE